MKSITSCPVCGHGEMSSQTITEQFEYKGQGFKIENYKINQCPNCEESILDPETLRRAEKQIRDFHRRVDGLLTSEEIKGIRTNIGYSQKEMGLLLGGGAKGFARYESGTITQSRAMDNLLRIIKEKPEIIKLLREARQESEKITVS